MTALRFSIRTKLFLLSIAILGIPYFGFEYLRELERYLQDAQELSLVDAARAVAGPLHDQQALFPEVEPDIRPIYMHEFIHPIQLDGYTDDWLSYMAWADIYTSQAEDSDIKDPLSYRVIVSRYDQYINVVLQVDDSNIIFQKPGPTTSLDNDHIVLVYTNYQGELESYYFSPTAPGSIRPFYYRTHRDEFNISYRTAEFANHINGVFQPTDNGFNLEILIPRRLVGQRLGFIVSDVDDDVSREVIEVVGTAGSNTSQRPGRLVQSSPVVTHLIEKLPGEEGRRIWILDEQGTVLSTTGTLERTQQIEPVNIIYSIILPSVSKRFSDDLRGASRLQGREVLQALAGNTATNWRSSPDDLAVILSAASPVLVDGSVRGVVVVEETTNKIQLVQRDAMKSLFNKSVMFFAIVTLLLLTFATRLSMRLRRLSDDAENAIDEHGRVIASIRTSHATDEIGELSRSYSAMLERLGEYNQYLESMSGKLSHELRTPISVVQSSLEHLQEGQGDASGSQYLERACEGIERLNLIVTRLSEATRLEQALQSANKSPVDISGLLTSCIDGYRMAYPDITFELEVPDKAVMLNVAPDLVVQMLDKLVDNAVGFSDVDKPVIIKLAVEDGYKSIHVTNSGPELPEVMEDQLFNSMVSIRTKKDPREPHLGLGLYIVRLIAEYHGARVTCRNLRDAGQVTFTVSFP